MSSFDNLDYRNELVKNKLLKTIEPNISEVHSEGEDSELEDNAIVIHNNHINRIDKEVNCRSLSLMKNVSDGYSHIDNSFINRDLMWCKNFGTSKGSILKNTEVSILMNLKRL